MNLIKKSLISSIKKLFFLVKIEGESAWPQLISGKVYLATKMMRIGAGNYIVFVNPKREKEVLVKKVVRIYQDFYFVEGNVSWATSSQKLGLIPKSLVLGRVIR